LGPLIADTPASFRDDFDSSGSPLTARRPLFAIALAVFAAISAVLDLEIAVASLLASSHYEPRMLQ
jgi:hypothetical protein